MRLQPLWCPASRDFALPCSSAEKVTKEFSSLGFDFSDWGIIKLQGKSLPVEIGIYASGSLRCLPSPLKAVLDPRGVATVKDGVFSLCLFRPEFNSIPCSWPSGGWIL